MSLLDGLQAYWPLNETSGTRSDVHGSSDLTDGSSVGSAAGKIGNAAAFVRTSTDYLEKTDNADLSVGGTNFFMSHWVYLSNKSNPFGIAGRAVDDFNLDYQSHYQTFNDRFFFSLGNGSSANDVIANALGSPSASTWYHIVVWYLTTGTIGIRINDTYENTNSVIFSPVDSTMAFRIGAFNNFWYLDGRVDETGFWKRAPVAADFTALYNDGNGLPYPFNRRSYAVVIG